MRFRTFVMNDQKTIRVDMAAVTSIEIVDETRCAIALGIPQGYQDAVVALGKDDTFTTVYNALLADWERERVRVGRRDIDLT